MLGPPEAGQVVPEAPGRHAREPAEELLEALVQGVDHVQRVGCLGGGRCVVGGCAQPGRHARVARVPVGGHALAGPSPSSDASSSASVGLPRPASLQNESPRSFAPHTTDAGLERGYAALAHGASVLVGPAGHPIYCSQYREPGWLERLGGGTSAEGIVDRIANNCYRVDLSGDVNMRELASRVAR